MAGEKATKGTVGMSCLRKGLHVHVFHWFSAAPEIGGDRRTLKRAMEGSNLILHYKRMGHSHV